VCVCVCCVCLYMISSRSNAIGDHKDKNLKFVSFIILNTPEGQWLDTVLQNIIQYRIKLQQRIYYSLI